MVQQRMKERGVTRSALARMVNVDPSAITVLFSDKTTQTRLLPAIYKALGLADTQRPASVIAADELRMLTQLWADLSEDDRRTVFEVARGLARASDDT